MDPFFGRKRVISSVNHFFFVIISNSFLCRYMRSKRIEFPVYKKFYTQVSVRRYKSTVSVSIFYFRHNHLYTCLKYWFYSSASTEMNVLFFFAVVSGNSLYSKNIWDFFGVHICVYACRHFIVVIELVFLMHAQF